MDYKIVIYQYNKQMQKKIVFYDLSLMIELLDSESFNRFSDDG